MTFNFEPRDIAQEPTRKPSSIDPQVEGKGKGSWGRLAAVIASLACAMACAQPGASRADAFTSSGSGIAVVHAHKCGRCHQAPEPKTRSRDYVETVLSRHHRRVRLSDEEWRAMAAYLAASDQAIDQVIGSRAK